MRLSELAKTLNTPVQELMGRAKKSNLKINHDTQLTPDQITQLKRVEEQPIARPHLLAQSEEFLKEIVHEEQVPVLSNDATDVASIKQNAVTQASDARQAQERHILQTRLQQASEDGLYEGVVTGLTREHSRIKGLMLVTDAAFQSEAAQREKYGELMASLLGENSDFLTQYQGAAQTYSESAKIGATSSPNIMQVINNLRNS
jgi:hypothetical protein